MEIAAVTCPGPICVEAKLNLEYVFSIKVNILMDLQQVKWIFQIVWGLASVTVKILERAQWIIYHQYKGYQTEA